MTGARFRARCRFRARAAPNRSAGKRPEIFHFRDQQGLEVDFVAPGPAGSLRLIEAKWTRTVTPDMARALARLAVAMQPREVECIVVGRGGPAGPRSLAPGVRALSVEELLGSAQTK